MIESEYSFILFKLIQLLCCVLVLNHVIACVWYVVGRVSMGESLPNWVDVAKVKGSAISYLYATALHWSLTQFTPASMDISANNLWERLFSVSVLLFAMLVFSSIVASITAAMMKLRNMQGDQMRQFWLLRLYLRQRNIHPSLASRIVKFLEHRSAVQGSLVQRDSIPILCGLSEALHNELMHEMHSPELRCHPFFETLEGSAPAMMHQLCRSALNLQLYAVQDMVFTAGDESKKMFFIKNGDFDYVSLTSGLKVSLQQKDWLTEPVLFTTWRHRGSLQAMSGAELVAIDPKQFMIVMSVHPKPWQYAVTYAKAFVKFLNSLPDDLTDILRCEDMYQELMASCPYTVGEEAMVAAKAVPMEVNSRSLGTPTSSHNANESKSLKSDGSGKETTDEANSWRPLFRLWLPCQPGAAVQPQG